MTGFVKDKGKERNVREYSITAGKMRTRAKPPEAKKGTAGRITTHGGAK